MNLREYTGEFPENAYLVKINSLDHTPPHIHVITDEYNVRFRVSDGETIEKKPKELAIATKLVPKVKRWLDAKPAFGPFPTNREACEFEWHRLYD